MESLDLVESILNARGVAYSPDTASSSFSLRSSVHSIRALTVQTLGAMGATLASIENAQVSFKPPTENAMAHAFVTPSQLSSRLSAHYRRQALSQIYKLLGASDIIGNPFGVLSSLKQGLKDFIVGFTPKWSPGAFSKGVALGTLSLARSALHGVAYGTTRALFALNLPRLRD